VVGFERLVPTSHTNARKCVSWWCIVVRHFVREEPDTGMGLEFTDQATDAGVFDLALVDELCQPIRAEEDGVAREPNVVEEDLARLRGADAALAHRHDLLVACWHAGLDLALPKLCPVKYLPGWQRVK
jgi:hypothetical protein